MLWECDRLPLWDFYHLVVVYQCCVLGVVWVLSRGLHGEIHAQVHGSCKRAQQTTVVSMFVICFLFVLQKGCDLFFFVL
jgi:hypothetical protein